MDLEEKTLKSTLIHKGRITEYYDDEVVLPDGKTTFREYVKHVGGSAILPIDIFGNVYLVKQFRYPYKEVLLEIPAGKREPDETPEQCASRELKEETGTNVKELKKYGVFYPSPGYTNEKLYIFEALVDGQGAQMLDDNEFIDIELMPIDQAYRKVLSGDITDGKTAYAICRYMAQNK